MLNASKKRQLQSWYNGIDDNAFQKAIENNQFSTDELRWLLREAVNSSNIVQMQSVLHTNTINGDIVDPLYLAAYRKHLESIETLLPYASQSDVRTALLYAVWDSNETIVQTLLNQIPQNEQQSCLQGMLNESVDRRRIAGVAFCLKHSQTQDWDEGDLNRAMQLALVRLSHRDITDDNTYFVFNYCLKVFCDSETGMNAATQYNICNVVDPKVFQQFVDTLSTDDAQELTLELASRTAKKDHYDEKAQILFKYFSKHNIAIIHNVLHILYNENELDAVDYLTEQYAVYQKNILMNTITDKVVLGQAQRSRKI